jgi:hypothetical protein
MVIMSSINGSISHAIMDGKYCMMCGGNSNQKCVEMMREYIYVYAMFLGQLYIFNLNMPG